MGWVLAEVFITKLIDDNEKNVTLILVFRMRVVNKEDSTPGRTGNPYLNGIFEKKHDTMVDGWDGPNYRSDRMYSEMKRAEKCSCTLQGA